MDRSSELFVSHTLEDLFFNHGYDLTSDEASKILDVTERYLCDLLKDCFDFVTALNGSKEFLSEENLDKLQNANHPIFQRYDFDELVSKRRRKIFINRDDFRNYLINDLYYVKSTTDEKGKTIDELIPLPTKWIDKIMDNRAILFSQKTIKQRFGFNHNMQVYRFIKKNPSLIRVQLMTISDQKPVVRFLALND